MDRADPHAVVIGQREERKAAGRDLDDARH
jgi:hypothetical protein